MARNELKPCPFCGREVIVVNIGGGWFWKHKTEGPSIDMYGLQSYECPIRYSCKYDTKEEAIETWNTRCDKSSRPKETMKPILIISKEDS